MEKNGGKQMSIGEEGEEKMLGEAGEGVGMLSCLSR